MKAHQKLLAAGLALGLCLAGTSCMTTYDAQGRPVESVSPEGAALGAVAAGLIGYAIADDKRDNYRHRGYYPRGHYGGHYGGYHNRGYRHSGYRNRGRCY